MESKFDRAATKLTDIAWRQPPSVEQVLAVVATLVNCLTDEERERFSVIADGIIAKWRNAA